MIKIINVLIIDDHQLIIDAFKNALSFVKKSLENIEFKIDDAKNCETAFNKIITASKEKGIDLIYLDIRLPPSLDNKIFSGEDLGIKINEYLPSSKIIVCTDYNDNLRLNNIIKTINPDGFLMNDPEAELRGIKRKKNLFLIL